MFSFSKLTNNLLIVLDADYEVHIDYCKQGGSRRIFVASFKHLKQSERPLALHSGEFIYLTDKEDQNKLKKLFVSSMYGISVKAR